MFPTYMDSTEARRCHRSSSSAKTCLAWLILIFKIIPEKNIGIYLTFYIQFGDVTFTTEHFECSKKTLEFYFYDKSGYVGGLVHFYIQPKKMHWNADITHGTLMLKLEKGKEVYCVCFQKIISLFLILHVIRKTLTIIISVLG